MDKPRFTVIENGEKRAVDTPEEVRRKECEEDAIVIMRETLRDLKDRSQGRCVGIVIAIAYDDGTAGSRRSETCALPALIGAVELAKHSAMQIADTTASTTPELGDDDE